MQAQDPMKALLAKLDSDLGVKPNYVRSSILPSWWDDSLAKTAAGMAEARVVIARNLGVELTSFQEDRVRLQSGTRTKYKLPKDQSADTVAVARSIAERVSRAAVQGVSAPFTQVAPASAIRKQLLASGQPWVSLDGIIAYCWGIGIPVLLLTNLPKGSPKMHGMTVRIGQRPVIIVSKKGSPAWLLFIIAHELGHIAHGHVDPDSMLIEDVHSEESDDLEESEANNFALELITGSATRRFFADGQWPRAADLFREAKRIGSAQKILPGHIVLNFAHTMSRRKPDRSSVFWGTANAALKMLESASGSTETIRKHMNAGIEWDSLHETTAEFLARMTGIEVPEA